MKFIVTSDIHFDHCTKEVEDNFIQSLKDIKDVNTLLICGDISNQSRVADDVINIRKGAMKDTFWCRGNHDHWGVKYVSEFDNDIRNNKNLPESRTPLSDSTVLLGRGDYIGMISVDGWADGGYRKFSSSNIVLHDEQAIRELRAHRLHQALMGFELDPSEKRKEFARKDALRLTEQLESMVMFGVKKVVIITHIPPFIQMIVKHHKYNREDSIPWFTCKATGDVLRKFAKANPDVQYTVFCGHTHEAVVKQILPNLKCESFAAEYGKPTFYIREV